MKTKIKWYDVICHILLAFLLFAAFLSSSVFFTLSFKPLYYLDMKVLDIQAEAEEFGVVLTEEQIKKNYDALIDYNLPLKDGELSLPDLAMSEDGKQHFSEVKDIFDIFKIVCMISLPLSAIGIFFFYEKKQRLYLLFTAGLCLGLPLVGGALIAVNWQNVFIRFHEIFFDNDKWIFHPRYDPVITILPDEFFMHCALMILAGVIAGGVACLVVYLVKNKKRAVSK